MSDTPQEAHRKLEQANDTVSDEPQRAAGPSLKEVSVKRGWQTLLQSLAVDVAVALALALSVLIGPWEGWEDVQWAVLGFVVAKSVVQAVVAWVIRRFVDRSGYRQ